MNICDADFIKLNHSSSNLLMDIAPLSAQNESLEESRTMLDDLNLRLEKYLSVLKSAESEGNKAKVRRYNRIVKQYKDAIGLCKKGLPVPLNDLPNPPGFEPLVKSSLEVPDSVTPEVSPSLSRKEFEPPNSSDKSVSDAFLVNVNSDDVLVTSNVEIPILVNDQNIEEISQDPNEIMNVLEELQSRLDVYKSVLKSAEDEGNASKARRYKRIIKQYTDAIALHKSGKPVPLEDLPSPPGFSPLVPVKSEPPSPVPSRSNSFFEGGFEDVSPTENPSSVGTISEPSTSNESTSTIQPFKVTRSEAQMAILKERQKEYRTAALEAKKEGNIEKAKEYLKLCKGFDRLIQASESGLPVDLSTLPVSLKDKKKTEEKFDVVTHLEAGESENSEIYATLEKELMDQIKMCMNTRNHFKMNGDISKANQFEQFALQFKKDLNYVKVSHSKNHPVPKFHYENKTFSTIKSNVDLTDNDLELTIVQGINYKVSNPNDVDTYVMYEFPYPSSSPPSGRTSTVKNTNNPVYNTRVVFPINREASACQRVFKRHGIKMEVWSKGGFFHRDSSLGTVVVKLMPLAKDIKIHEAFDLMNGRRPAGGKLEVQVRIRDPIAGKKVEIVSEKWLIIDYN